MFCFKYNGTEARRAGHFMSAADDLRFDRTITASFKIQNTLARVVLSNLSIQGCLTCDQGLVRNLTLKTSSKVVERQVLIY